MERVKKQPHSKPAAVRRIVAMLVLLLFAAAFGGQLVADSVSWQNLPACVQFVPALLRGIHGSWPAFGVVAALVVLTLVFGRVYCSWICPLGILQDLVVHLRPSVKLGRYMPNHWIVRTVFGVLAFGSLACGSLAVLSVLDPYTVVARAATAFLDPVVEMILGQPDDLGRYAPWLWVLAALSLLLPLLMAFFRGRLYCNTICPVGALLGLLSRHACLAPKLRLDTCAHCGSCMRACKSNCIDIRNGKIDSTRCVACYDCLSVCRTDSITLKKPAKPSPARAAAAGQGDCAASISRRTFLGIGAFGAATIALPSRAQEPWEAAQEENAESDNPAAPGTNTAPAAIPPGGQNVELFLSRCTGCGLCIANCPTHVLRPSYMAHGLQGFMKPYMNLTEHACADSCNICSNICPEGALLPLPLEVKQRTQIALASHHQEHCDVWIKGEPCGKCAQACPTGAMQTDTLLIPFIIPEKCVACRRCVKVCPHHAITITTIEGRSCAVVDRSLCVGCGACGHACRHGAIDSRKLDAPYMKPARCIGCGACVVACPAKPVRAMVVTPRFKHLTASPRLK